MNNIEKKLDNLPIRAAVCVIILAPILIIDPSHWVVWGLFGLGVFLLFIKNNGWIFSAAAALFVGVFGFLTGAIDPAVLGPVVGLTFIVARASTMPFFSDQGPFTL